MVFVICLVDQFLFASTKLAIYFHAAYHVCTTAAYFLNRKLDRFFTVVCSFLVATLLISTCQ